MIEIHCKYDKLLSIKEIKPDPENRNKHDKEQIENLAEIIEYQGWRHPLIINQETGLLRAGHGRLQAAKKLKLKEVPVVYQSFKDSDQDYAFMVSDNAIARQAELDLSGINADIGKLGPDFDIKLLGIKDFKIDIFDEPEGDPDEVPEVKEESKVIQGEVYILGNHRLMCGDSTSITDVENLMNGEKADMVFTDPPYGVSYQSNMRTKTNKFDVLKNDEVFISEWINCLPLVSTGWVFVWTTWKVIGQWIEICKPLGEMTNMIIWDKGGGGIGDLKKTFLTDYEIALVFNRGANITGKRLGSVWSVNKDSSSKYLHPTQKPVELGSIALENCTKVKELVLDLFGGSGSTLIAAEKTNRKANLMELDPKYCQVILDRWQKYTGKKAIREDGKLWDNIKEGK